MLYKELVEQMYETIINERKIAWDDDDIRILALKCANKLTDSDDDWQALVHEGICPNCFADGELVTDGLKTLCGACGKTYEDTYSEQWLICLLICKTLMRLSDTKV